MICSPCPLETLPAVASTGTMLGIGDSERRSTKPLPLQADGEDLGDVTEASFTAERNALTVLA